MNINLKEIEHDSFVDLSYQEQCLFFHLCVRAEKDGFVRNPRFIARGLRINETVLEELEKNNFIRLEGKTANILDFVTEEDEYEVAF